MLLELRVENLLLIERAELRLGEGLNVITGETGAGKTMLAHALDLLLGGKPRPGIVRPGAKEAWVEGVFDAATLAADPDLGELRDRLPEGEAELVLARRVGPDGRTRAFVGGRSASAADLRELGGRMLAFYGQHEHRRLTVASSQLDILDGFCGTGQAERREALAAAHARVHAVAKRLEALAGVAGARERDLDLLVFEIGEIEALGPTEAEEADLLAERSRLRNLEGLRAAAGGAAEAMAPESGEGHGGALLVAEAERLAGAVEGMDPDLDGLAARLRALRIEADDLAAGLRAYGAGLEGEPGRLEEVEERLDRYDRLKRKHGGSVEAVLAHAERCRAERDRLERAHVDLAEAEAELAEARTEERELAGALRAERERSAPLLAERVASELADLAMEDAEFQVRLDPRDDIGPAGSERVEFLLAPNPGVTASPIRDAASGGELSRVMLALMSVAAGGGGRPTLVFDEVDAGIGGQTARAVGERLRRLADGRQVLCITHLPQVASLAERHFRIRKETGGELAHTLVEPVEGDGVVEELCRMLGADTEDEGARRHAEELLAAA
ncbi:MAG TPA: DNA repair protein RecN [Thermoleophilaceae bacterium]|nr:DNA repair protein RecN [Thermoleophilaceae bacterium]